MGLPLACTSLYKGWILVIYTCSRDDKHLISRGRGCADDFVLPQYDEVVVEVVCKPCADAVKASC